MPPKKPAGPSKKTVDKQKEKVIEDKTFGLKNKKGGKQQKFIQHVQKQVQSSGPKELLEKQKKLEETKKKKEADKEKIAELNELLKPVIDVPKVGKDVDPKSIVCAFFKQGMCSKGDRCKWSHDLSIEHKTQKRNVYFDAREGEGDAENADDWDEEKLNDVVNKKHGAKDANKPKTGIICKYFLEALENSKYGWFWECPNGDTCIYRHALPQGYVLKKDRKKLDADKPDQITLEELIEKERASLGAGGTKVTYESFIAWKKRKLRERKRAAEDDDAKKRAAYKQGKKEGMSGRDMFTFDPSMAANDDDAADDAGASAARDDSDVDSDAEPEPAAFEIDEALFYQGLDGLDDLDDEDAPGPSTGDDATVPAVANGVGAIAIDDRNE